MRWKDELGSVKKFKLVTKVSSKWRNFGILLSHEMDQLEAWSQECLGVSSRCWYKVMNYWITEDDSPDYPTSWRGLLLMLEDAEYSEVAKELKKVLTSIAPAPDIGNGGSSSCPGGKRRMPTPPSSPKHSSKGDGHTYTRNPYVNYTFPSLSTPHHPLRSDNKFYRTWLIYFSVLGARVTAWFNPRTVF